MKNYADAINCLEMRVNMSNLNNRSSNKSKYDKYGGNNADFHYTQYGSDGLQNQFQDKSYGSAGNNYNQDMYGYNNYMNNNYNPSNNYNGNNMNYNNQSNNYNYGNNANNEYNNYNNGYSGNNYNSANNYGNNNYNNIGNNYGNNYGNNNYNNNKVNNNYNYNSYGNNNYSNNYGNGNANSNVNSNSNSITNNNSNNKKYNSGYNYTSYGANDYDKTMYNESEYGSNGYSSNEDCEITVLTPAKSHVVMEAVLRIVMIIFIGTALGKLLNGVFRPFWEKHIYNENYLELGINVVGIIIIIIVSYFLHIVLHEFGHLVGGTISNYSLISFRIFSFVLTKENKKLSVKKYSVPNTVGECVMMPPEVKNGKYPYKLYRVGGIAMNIITSILALVLVFGVSAFSKFPLNMLGVIFATVGFVTAIYNGLPVMIGGVPNDGYLLLHMTESVEARLAVHSQLLIHAFLSKGGSYSEVPYEQFCINKSGEIKNYLVANIKLEEYKWHLEHLDFTQAAKCLEATNQYFNSLPKVYQYEINSEKLFVEIMCENNKDIVDKLYGSDVERFISEFQNILTRNRIMMAYEAGVKKDVRAAHKHYMQLKNNVKVYPIKGAADLELTLADYVYERFCSNSANNVNLR